MTNAVKTARHRWMTRIAAVGIVGAAGFAVLCWSVLCALEAELVCDGDDHHHQMVESDHHDHDSPADHPQEDNDAAECCANYIAVLPVPQNAALGLTEIGPCVSLSAILPATDSLRVAVGASPHERAPPSNSPPLIFSVRISPSRAPPFLA